MKALTLINRVSPALVRNTIAIPPAAFLLNYAKNLKFAVELIER